jgi:GHMP kinases N terminal domain
MLSRSDSEFPIVSQAPCRADLAGGTIDLWPLYLFHSGALTINFAVEILTTCRVRPLRGKRILLRSRDTRKEESFNSLDDLNRAKKFRHPLAARLVQFFVPQQGLEIETDSQSPAGAGISGSSALMIATTAALARFTGRSFSLEQMRVIAQNVEAQLIGKLFPWSRKRSNHALCSHIRGHHASPESTTGRFSKPTSTGIATFFVTLIRYLRLLGQCTRDYSAGIGIK